MRKWIRTATHSVSSVLGNCSRHPKPRFGMITLWNFYITGQQHTALYIPKTSKISEIMFRARKIPHTRRSRVNNLVPFAVILEESWWLHQMELLSALLALSVGNSPVTVEFISQRPVRRGIDIFFELLLKKKRLRKQLRSRWFKTPSRSQWRHCNVSTSICQTFTTIHVVKRFVLICAYLLVNDIHPTFKYVQVHENWSQENRNVRQGRLIKL